MALFKRSGEPVKLPDDVHAHASALTTQKNAAAVTLAELRARIADLEDAHRVANLEGRFEDASSAAAELEYARADMQRAEAAHSALEAAEKEVNRERARAELQRRIADAKQRRDDAMTKCQQKMADLPVVLAELEQLARAALADEQELQAADMDLRANQVALEHFDSPQVPLPGRVILPRPVTTMFERDPRYRALSNGAWMVGIGGGPNKTP